jgi:hypothetical protein
MARNNPLWEYGRAQVGMHHRMGDKVVHYYGLKRGGGCFRGGTGKRMGGGAGSSACYIVYEWKV